MITLIHGEDTAASRNYFFELKKASVDSKQLEGQSVTSIDLQQTVEGSDLFGTVPIVFIDELISKRKSPKEIEQLINILNTSEAAITVWESKTLTPKQLQQFNNVTIKEFKIPSTIFALLDSLKPGNGKVLIEQFHQTLQDKDPEFVLVMLQRQIRILLAISSKSSLSSLGEGQGEVGTISEVSRMAPWQKGKLDKQTKLFTPERLKNLHAKLFQLELGMKTGGLTLPLPDSIDLLLLSI